MSYFFSIIVPIYNVECYIKKCIDSILTQTYNNWELILVDDGSPDNSEAICKSYADNRIKYIKKENGGLVSARKAGAEIASGDYVICLDGDDWLHKLALEKIAHEINENNKPDIICFGIIYAFSNKEIETKVRNRSGYYNKNEIISEVFPMLIQRENATYFAPSLCGKAISLKLYKEQQMAVPNDLLIGEDGACTIPCVYLAKSLYIMDDYLYYYRQLPTSMTKARKILSWDIPVNNAAHIGSKVDLSKYDFQEQLYRKICHDTFLVVISSFYSTKHFLEVRKEDIKELRNEVISTAIQKAKFKKSYKAILLMICLRNKIFFPLKLYSMVRR